MKAHIPYLLIIAALLFLLLVGWIPQCSSIKDCPEPKVKPRDSAVVALLDSVKKHEGNVEKHEEKRSKLKAKRDVKRDSIKTVFDSTATKKDIEKELGEAIDVIETDDSIFAEDDTIQRELKAIIAELKQINILNDSTNSELVAQNHWLQCELDKAKKGRKTWRIIAIVAMLANIRP